MTADEEVSRAPDVAREAAVRTAALLHQLRALDAAGWAAPSELPGWSRLTIACHLRYGAAALRRITEDALAGRPTAYYPGGREAQRPATLRTAPGESPEDVLADWAASADRLDRRWTSLDGHDWATTVREPADNADLGAIPLARFALARLTEVDVHGTDLGIGFPDWSRTLVEVALPTRLGWLPTRRTNHRGFDASICGAWHLVGDPGFRWLVSVDGHHVESRPVEARDGAPRATIEGSRRDLLALLLDRPRRRPLRIEGDAAFGEAFSRAFPGP